MALEKKRLGDLLVEMGKITDKDLQKALFYQKKTQGKVMLGTILVELGIITSSEIADALAHQGHKRVYLDDHDFDVELVKKMTERMLRENEVIPYGLDEEKGILYLAMSNVMNYKVADEVRALYGVKKVEGCSSSRDEIIRAIDNIFTFSIDPNMKAEFIEENDDDDDDLLADDSPIIKFVNDLLARAVGMGVSDIHIEPQIKRDTRVRFRVDGELIEYTNVSYKWHSQIVSRIKIMSNLDISKRYEPQDGEIRFKYSTSTVNLRVSILPLVHKEKIVIRVLGQSSDLLPLDKVGLTEANRRKIEEKIVKKQGMILVTGPTGSGKTTTLYAMLNSINVPTKNISTIEDPVEIKIFGLNQVQINKRISFADTLRSLLRQDPDVIMVGEIRDTETAGISVKAALTGHLVLSTLHTNSALATITRLMDMGIETYLIADALEIVVSQRLARRICSNCKVEDVEGLKVLKNVYPEEFKELGIEKIYKGEGCKQCNNTGYKGRVPVQEVLMVDDELKGFMIKRDLDAIRDYGVKNLMLYDGLEKIKSGDTTFEQINTLMIDFT